MPLTADSAAIRQILRADRTWAIYALADLDPEYSGPAEWHIAPDGRPALLLVYRRFDPPVLFAFGDARDLEPLLPEIAADQAFYLSMRLDAVDLLRANGYAIHSEWSMWRMTLDPARFAPCAHNAVRLGLPDFEQLRRLYGDGTAAGEAPPFFDAGMLRHGVYYGIREGGDLLAAAGTHVLSKREAVAGIGNVYTRRDRRGRGLASQATSAVAAELLSVGVPMVALNVTQSNNAAISVYEQLGFRRYCAYREGRASVPQLRPPGEPRAAL